MRYLIGIDEAGRGPIAGPVAVGTLCIAKETEKQVQEMFEGARDSKKHTARQREKWYEKIQEARREKLLRFSVAFAGADMIDRKGIVYAIRIAMRGGLDKIKADPSSSSVLLDGSLHAPDEFLDQKTIIGGDDTELVISLASIVAKVERDRYMTKMAPQYSAYGFEKHKGYGTKGHYEVIKKEGLCDLHRRTFLKIGQA